MNAILCVIIINAYFTLEIDSSAKILYLDPKSLLPTLACLGNSFVR